MSTMFRNNTRSQSQGQGRPRGGNKGGNFQQAAFAPMEEEFQGQQGFGNQVGNQFGGFGGQQGGRQGGSRNRRSTGVGRGYAANAAGYNEQWDRSGRRSEKQQRATAQNFQRLMQATQRGKDPTRSLCGRAANGNLKPQTVQRLLAEGRIDDQQCNFTVGRYGRPVSQAAQAQFYKGRGGMTQPASFARRSRSQGQQGGNRRQQGGQQRMFGQQSNFAGYQQGMGY
jgi:hypothetical protein